MTDRPKIIKIAGNYHGHVDALLVQAGSSATTLGVPNSLGVTRGSTQDTILCPFNTPAAVGDILKRYRGQIAAVLLEPVTGNMGLVPPIPDYLEKLRDITLQHGTLLIFDEVMTGFRLAYGGAQALYSVTPDVSILGKIVGGGLPAAAFGASTSIMDQVSPVGPIFQAGTLSGNPLAMAAGLTTLRILRDTPPYDHLENLTARLAEGLHRAGTDARVPHVVQRVGSMLTIFFNEHSVHEYRDALRSDTKRFARFFWEMLARGVYLPCSQFEAAFVSATHSQADIDHTIDAAYESLQLLRP